MDYKLLGSVMYALVSIVAAVVSIAIWYFFIRPLNYWKNIGVPQTKPWVFFGDSWHTVLKRTALFDFTSMIYNMYPGTRYSGMYIFNRPTLVLKDPELIKHIGVKDFEHFTDRPPLIDPDADPLWSNALFSLKGDRWKQIRVTLSPTFTSSKIKGIYVLMVETAENFINHFLEKEDDLIEFEMKNAYSRFTNDIIATTAFGVKVDSLKDKTNAFYEMGKKLTSFDGILTILRFIGHLSVPKLLKHLGLRFLDKEASEYFYSVINDTIRIREEQHIIRPDLIHLMLEARKEIKTETKESGDRGKTKAVKITNAEITAQATIFFFAGFDTVSTVICFASYELALQKDIQDRLREEINQTQKDSKVSYDDLMGMKYMDMVVSEALRKWPPFPALDRICTKSYTIEPVNEGEKTLEISANQQVWLPIYGLQMDPKYYPNPEKFDPERFSDENKHKIVPYTYMPFGVGPRICIGNRFALVEIKALLFYILLNFEIVPTKKTQIPVKVSKNFNHIPDDGFWLGLKRIRT